MALIDFTLSNARRFYSSMGNPLGERVNNMQSQKLWIFNYCCLLTAVLLFCYFLRPHKPKYRNDAPCNIMARLKRREVCTK